MGFESRRAIPSDLAVLPAIERSADQMFGDIGIAFPPGPTVIEELDSDAVIFVAGDPPVGFAAMHRLDGATYLDQIAVHRDLVGHGIGVQLLDAVKSTAREAGSPGVALLTFRDVPWNAPWYAKHGYVKLQASRWGPGITSLWDNEIEIGLHELGPRLAMWSDT